MASSRNVYVVILRARVAKRLRVSRGERLRALFLIIAIPCVPVLGTLVAVVSTIQPDLSDLAPRNQTAGQFRVHNWSALRQGDIPAGTSVQALGYMMETNRSIRASDWVRIFILLPEAGNLLHPAHTSRDQMIEVQLRGDESIKFSPGSLVWVWAVFQAVSGDPGGLQPLYRLVQAHVELADKSDIPKYFR